MRFNAWVTFSSDERKTINDGFYLGNLYLESTPLSAELRETHAATIRGFSPEGYKGQFTSALIRGGLMVLGRIEAAIEREAEELAPFKNVPKVDAKEGSVLIIPDPAKAVDVIAEARARQRRDIETARHILKRAEKKITALELVCDAMSPRDEDEIEFDGN